MRNCCSSVDDVVPCTDFNSIRCKADTVQYASDYYTWLVIGAPFIILSFTPSNLLRTEGFSVASMTGTVLGSVINIILDPILSSCLAWEQPVQR